jgi:plastocyanin
MSSAKRFGHRGWLSRFVLLAFVSLAAVSTPACAAAVGGEIRGTVIAVPPKYLAGSVVYVADLATTRSPVSFDMDQRGLQFMPQVLVITKGDAVRFLNHDHVAHNVFSPDHETFDLGNFDYGQTRSYTFSESTGVYTILCSIHPDMLAYVFVGSNPFAAQLDASGHYSIAGVPAGKRTVKIWNPHLKAPKQSITVSAGKTTVVDFTLRH